MAAITVTAASVVLTSGAVTHGTAGGTITAGMSVYRDVADANKLKPARANTANTAAAYGIALNGASAGQPVSVARTAGSLLGFGTNTVLTGLIYCVSDAVAGQIVPSGDLNTTDFTSVLGIATNTSHITININNSGVAQA